MGENIGAAARAMKNFGLRDLRLVAPRDGWPNDLAVATSVGASDLLGAARLFSTLQEATADLTYIYAATARRRFMHKDYIMSRDLAADYASHFSKHGIGTDAGGSGDVDVVAQSAPQEPRVALMFGRESSGLTNEEVAMAGKIVVVDSDPEFAVLNLAQAVVVCCYELYPLLRSHGAASAGSDVDSSSAGGVNGVGGSLGGSGPGPFSGNDAPRARSAAALVASGGSASGSCSDGVGPSSGGGSGSYAGGSFTGGGGSYESMSDPDDGRLSSFSDSDDWTVGSASFSFEGRSLQAPDGRAAAATSSSDSSGSRGSGGTGDGGVAGPESGGYAPPSGSPSRPDLGNPQDLATLGDSEGLLERLFAELDDAGYFEVESRRPSTQANIRNLLRRVPRLSKQEVASLHGMLSKLVGKRKGR